MVSTLYPKIKLSNESGCVDLARAYAAQLVDKVRSEQYLAINFYSSMGRFHVYNSNRLKPKGSIAPWSPVTPSTNNITTALLGQVPGSPVIPSNPMSPLGIITPGSQITASPKGRNGPNPYLVKQPVQCSFVVAGYLKLVDPRTKKEYECRRNNCKRLHGSISVLSKSVYREIIADGQGWLNSHIRTHLESLL